MPPKKKLTSGPQVKRTVKLVTTQSIDTFVYAPPSPSPLVLVPPLTRRSSQTPEPGALPLRNWDINIYLVGPDGEELPATCYEKATYLLHDSFGKRQKQVFKNPPFHISEQGWGEFDMQITLTPVGTQKGGEQTLTHDLNFLQERYEATHNVVCIHRKHSRRIKRRAIWDFGSSPAGPGSNASQLNGC